MSMTQTLDKPPRRAGWLLGAYALFVLLAAGLAFTLYGAFMDGYELAILAGSAVGLVALGRVWRDGCWYFPAAALTSLAGIASYQGDLARGQSAFLLKYLLSSQSSIMWMCTLFFLSMLLYWVALLRRSEGLHQGGSALCWAACVMGLAGLLTRWYESYLIGADVGHIPVSNLYEVFVLFCLITALMHLYYEAKYQARQTGAFVLLVINAAVGFILWYTFDRQAHEIQPLIPALQSWWMKIHVPANFVGYGAFALSAMLGIAWLLAVPRQMAASTRRGLFAAAVGLGLATLLFQLNAERFVADPENLSGAGFVAKFGYSGALLLLVAARRGALSRFIPRPELLEEISYRAIAVGFLFFTIATILGAMWAADAWGGYWSWDPKETWALIVWLNYAAWLHIRLVKGWRGEPLAWWAVIGLFITSFAFIGVNMFLSGLHSYGAL